MRENNGYPPSPSRNPDGFSIYAKKEARLEIYEKITSFRKNISSDVTICDNSGTIQLTRRAAEALSSNKKMSNINKLSRGDEQMSSLSR